VTWFSRRNLPVSTEKTPNNPPLPDKKSDIRFFFLFVRELYI
jgi:hypothetical protein